MKRKLNLTMLAMSIGLFLLSCNKDKDSIDNIVTYPKEINLVVGQTCLVSINAEHYENDSLVFSTNTIDCMSEDTIVASAKKDTLDCVKIKANSIGECKVWAEYKAWDSSIKRIPILVTVTNQGYTTYDPNDTVFIKVDEIKTIEFESTNNGVFAGWAHNTIENWSGGVCHVAGSAMNYVHIELVQPKKPFEISMYKYSLDWVGGQEGIDIFYFIDHGANIHLEIPIRVLPKEE